MTDLDLRSLADQLAVQHVTARYGRAVDWLDIPSMKDLYVDGAMVKFGSMELPAMAFCDFWSNMGGAMLARHHQMGVPVIQIDGDRAYVEATAVAACTVVGEHQRPRNFVEYYRYLFDMVRTATGWRVSSQRIIFVWSHGGPTPQGTEMGGQIDRNVDVSSPWFVKLK